MGALAGSPVLGRGQRARDAELSQRRHLLLLRSANQISQLKLFIESDKATPVERDLLRSALEAAREALGY